MIEISKTLSNLLLSTERQ